MSQTDPTVVRDWLKALGSLTAGSLPGSEVDAKLGAYAPLLACEYPNPETFCADSLAAVAKRFKFFPSYAEVCEHLDIWWRRRRDAAALRTAPIPCERLPAPPVDVVGDEARAQVSALVKAFYTERLFHQSRHFPADGAASANAPERQPAHPLSDGQLLAVYERLEAGGDRGAATRAVMLRQRIAAVAAQSQPTQPQGLTP